MDSILVLTTGGTIDKQYFDALSRYQVTDATIPRILETARVTHPFELQQLLRKDSLDLTDEDRARIIGRVREARHSKIVITHGTDTMTVTAGLLEGVSGKTIVFTGSLAPWRFSESDAAFNVGMAFAAAQTAAPGVYIAINGSVFPAARVVKDREQGRFVYRVEREPA